MQITHDEAHRLIQFKSDNSLNLKNEEALNAHLKECAECRGYSDELKDAVHTLRQTMHKQWHVRPLPLQMETINGRINSKGGVSIFLTTRKTLIGIAFVMFAFITWQSVRTNNTSAQHPSLGALPLIPTPSTQYTATNILHEDCKEIRYKVQDGDTLESVAHQFSISEEALVAANDLMSDSINASMELIIPFCDTTPTSTIYPPTFTTTPFIDATTYTPG